jgi:hypothetical protein
MALINKNTKNAGKLILRACLKAGYDVNSTMEACAVLAAALCRVAAKEEEIDAVEAYAELCEHAYGQCEEVNVKDWVN